MNVRFLAFVVGLASLGARTVSAAPSEAERAHEFVKQALVAEDSGDSAARDTLMQEAVKAAPDDPVVRWQQGQIRVGGEWKSYDDILTDAKSSKSLQRYREQRDASEPTVASQLKLALYCDRSGLKSQALAHWSAILELEPDHAEARRQLGFEMFQGRWIKRGDAAGERTKATRVAQTLRRLTPELKGIASQLEADTITIPEAAQELSKHAEAAVIPAWESLLSSKSRRGALAVVTALAKMTDPEASLSLTRHALSSEWPDVRLKAGQALPGRDENSYLPALLAELRGPWIGRREATGDGRNQLVYRYTAVADGPDQQTLRVLDEAYFLHGELAMAANMAVQAAGATSSQLERLREQENARINFQNTRVMKLLAEVTGEKAFDSPQDWWQWWDDHNEVYAASGKPIDTSYAFRSTSIVALPPPSPISPPGSTPSPPMRPTSGTRKDCLAGGTPILTQRGPVAVERVRIGDLVVAQNPDTGEVALQPVLRTTIREPEPLIRLTVGSETLRSSGGHPFWVSGQGWVRARDLKPGMRLHGLGRSVEIQTAEVETKATRSFNLVVAHWHSYFVGPGKILSHDNSVTEPTRTKIPGLTE